MIIPIFIPHAGCPHQCVFCNQKKITGLRNSIDASSIRRKVDDFLRTRKKGEPVCVAFYGGTFTALPISLQKEYLTAIKHYIECGEIESIRISTRPDYISRDILAVLQKHHVRTVELGVQSMNDNALARSNRGHTSAHTVYAAELLKEHGYALGVQLLVGLPGDTADTFSRTIQDIIRLDPDFVRLYPLIVLKDTELEALYKAGQYSPLSLDEAVLLCKYALTMFEKSDIDVIRIGLQATEELEKPGTVVAGPYHPAFGQLVESAFLLDKMHLALNARKEKSGEAVFAVHPGDMSAAVGQRRCNIIQLKKEFGLRSIRFMQRTHGTKKREPFLLSE